jgi:hypothetical protein
MNGDGLDGVDALIVGVQQRFPDFRFKLIGEPNGYGDHIRFSWGLGPDGVDSPVKGTDFAVLKEGRIRSIIGFFGSNSAGGVTYVPGRGAISAFTRVFDALCAAAASGTPMHDFRHIKKLSTRQRPARFIFVLFRI